MREIKFSILLQHDETGRIVERIFSYADIFNGTAKDEIGKLKRYAVIARREYINLHDKNGKEIYEGDICTNDGTMYSKTQRKMVAGRYRVYWNDDRWGLEDASGEDYDNGDYYHGSEITWHECEIIGNIYENQELLKEAQ